MHELKPIHKKAIPATLAKALRYRVLNEPLQAESIFRDVLRVDEHNQEVLVLLILALTDQFANRTRATIAAAEPFLCRLESEYDRAYYPGIIVKRWAKRLFEDGAPGHGPLRAGRAPPSRGQR